jgi:uncharacterized protein DUF4304
MKESPRSARRFILRENTMSSDDLKKIILAHMHAALKPLGFRKTRAMFSAEQDDSVLFIQLQSSVKSTKDLLLVTVNLGVFNRKIAASVGNTHAPNILEAHWRRRIGAFMPSRSDKWWDVKSEDEARTCGAEIVSVLKSVLPEMRNLASTDNLKEKLRAGATGLTDYEQKQFLRALEASDSSS